RDALLFVTRKLQLQRRKRLPGNEVLDFENVVQLTVEAVAPHLPPGTHLHQFNTNAETRRSGRNLTHQHHADTEFSPNTTRIKKLLRFVAKHRTARHHAQLAHPGEIVDQVVG